MKLVLISPEDDEPREHAVLEQLFEGGLERYHVRKPKWSPEKLASWLEAVSPEFRGRIAVHQHHDLVDRLGLGGRHWRDDGSAPKSATVQLEALRSPSITSRSCHDLGTLRGSLGHFDSVFFGPVFQSLSKPDHGPRSDVSREDVTAVLVHRTAGERRTTVFALGGITIATVPHALALGFDGVAVLGAIWQAPDPIAAFAELQETVCTHAA